MTFVVFYYFSIKIPVDDKEYITALISVGAVLAGFIATAIAILMALPSESVIGKLRTSGYIDVLVDYLAQALYGAVIFIIFCLVGFYGFYKCLVYSAILSSFGVFSILSFVRVASLLLKLIKHPVP